MSRQPTGAEFDQLKADRDRADRAYNQALTVLDRAIVQKPELPHAALGFDDSQISPLNASWRLAPDEGPELGTGWRHRFNGLVWRLIGPVMQRQQRFNALIVDHLNRDVRAAAESHATAAGMVKVLDSYLEALTTFQSRLIQYLQQITLYVDTKDRASQAGGDAALNRVTDELQKRSEQIDLIGTALNRVTDEFQKRSEQIDVLGTALNRVTDELQKRSEQIDLIGTALNRVTDEFQKRSEQIDLIGTALNRVTDEFQKHSEQINLRVTDEFQKHSEQINLRVTDEFQKHSEQINLITSTTHAMKREIKRLHVQSHEPENRAMPDHSRPTATLDAYKYVCFEDLFRGPREVITGRQRTYLPYFERASDVLDLGCGRGEFLTLLLEQRIDARGIDTNAEAVERCRARGLDVAQADALEYVGALPDASLGGLFSAQVVEHLEAEYLMQVLDEVSRALRPGSRVVLETINPACWVAFFSAYVRDPTHRHPLHPDTLTYLLQASGFIDVEIVYSTPVDDGDKLQRVNIDSLPDVSASRALAETINQHTERLNSLLFTYQDYAAIARRP